MTIPVTRLNHAVLYVRDLDRSVAFYRDMFGFREVSRAGNVMALLRAGETDNHHDLGLMQVGAAAPSPPRGATGLYHLAWEVGAIEDLAAARVALAEVGALVGQSDHGASKSLYAKDPDGNEFEVMWAVPREQWGSYDGGAITAPLNLERDLARFGAKG